MVNTWKSSILEGERGVERRLCGGGGSRVEKGPNHKRAVHCASPGFTTSYVRACHGAVGLLLPAAMWRRYASHGGPVRQRLGGGGGEGGPGMHGEVFRQTVRGYGQLNKNSLV